MDLKHYFLCSEDFVKEFSLTDISKPVNRFGDKVHVAKFDFTKINTIYEEREANGEYGYPRDIWARELTGCNTDLTMFSVEQAKEDGIFTWIINVIGASTEKNCAAVIGGLCQKEYQNPIEFFNQFSEDGFK